MQQSHVLCHKRVRMSELEGLALAETTLERWLLMLMLRFRGDNYQ